VLKRNSGIHSEPRYILASRSPRRAELLQQIDVSFVCDAVEVDESVAVGELPEDYVQRLSLQKAQATWQKRAQNNEPLLPVIGSDTSVIIHGHILGKPKNKSDAAKMLKQLSASRHQVLTAVTVIDATQTLTALSTTKVNFRALSQSEIDRYVNTGEPFDKAGSYAIQGYAAVFIDSIEGSYSGVMGLPLAETHQLLKKIQR
jgi:septum formation protein